MKKPEKRIKINNTYTLHDQCYNQACDIWEKYHKQEMKDLATLLGEVTRKCYVRKDDLPSEEEILGILTKVFSCKETKEDCNFQRCGKWVSCSLTVEAMARRIKENGNGKN